ncbi:MAG: cyclic nucleotide-binding domain-containing protein [Myxococcales bacterium]|nr:cyclic nucleotide-binding domain-containing protein [Myxococcales bacterium]
MGYTAGENPSPKQLRKLLRVFSDGLRKNPDDLLLRLKLAEVLRLLERFDEAISLYSSVAWSYAVAGNLVQAIMLCKLILELKPSHRETQQMLAKLYASKRIREEKQSVPVRKVGDRWVVDPRDGSQVGPAPVANQALSRPDSLALSPVDLGAEEPAQASTGPAPRRYDPGALADPAAADQAIGLGLGEQAAEARQRALMDTPPARPVGRQPFVTTSPEAPRAKRAESPFDEPSGPAPLRLPEAPAPLPRLHTPQAPVLDEPGITEPPPSNLDFFARAEAKANQNDAARARAKRKTKPPPYRMGPLVRDRPTPEDANEPAEAPRRDPVIISEDGGRIAVGPGAGGGEDFEKWRPTMMQDSVSRDEPETSVERDEPGSPTPRTRYGATNARAQHGGVHDVAGAGPSHEELPALPPLESGESMPETFVGSVESVSGAPSVVQQQHEQPSSNEELKPITGPVSREHMAEASSPEAPRREMRSDEAAARTGVQNIGRRRLRRETARMTKIRTSTSSEVLTSARPTSDNSGPVPAAARPSVPATPSVVSSGPARDEAEPIDREIGGRPARPTLRENVHQVTPSQIADAASAPPSVDDVRLIEDLDDVEIIRAAIATPQRDLDEQTPVAVVQPGYDPRPKPKDEDRHIKPTKRYARAQSRTQRDQPADVPPHAAAPSPAPDAAVGADDDDLAELGDERETELVRDEEATDPDPTPASEHAPRDSLGSDLAAAERAAAADAAAANAAAANAAAGAEADIDASADARADADAAEVEVDVDVDAEAQSARGEPADESSVEATDVEPPPGAEMFAASPPADERDGAPRDGARQSPSFDQTDVQSEEAIAELEKRARASGEDWSARIDRPTEVQQTVPPAMRADEPRPSRETVPMDSATASTLLRKDAELAYLEGPKVTECYAAISRQVRAEGADQDDEDLSNEDAAHAERALSDTIRELSARESAEALSMRDNAPALPLFSGLAPQAFVALVERLQRRHFQPGALVLREGDEGDSLMLVAAGKLEVLKADETGHIKLAVLEAGSFFGEFGLLTDQRRHASVRCLEECELLELRKEVLADLIREHPSIAQTLRRFYRERVLEMVMATSTIFQAVSPTERERVLSRFTTRRFMGSEVIVREGGESSSFYVVLIGEVVVTCRNEEGDDVEVGRLKEGDYFGEMSLISGYPAEATVRALRMTEVLVLDTRDFYELASLHPEIWAEVQRASRMRQATNERLLASRKASAMLV